jgi:hypothetical protein
VDNNYLDWGINKSGFVHTIPSGRLTCSRWLVLSHLISPFLFFKNRTLYVGMWRSQALHYRICAIVVLRLRSCFGFYEQTGR